MTDLFPPEKRKKFTLSNTLDDQSPIPSRSISNGEFTPLPQTDQQRAFEAKLSEIADTNSKKLNISRRNFLRSSSGMAAAFLSMNAVYGSLFSVKEAEAIERSVAEERAKRLSSQFIFDDQVHFVHEDFNTEFMLDYGRYAAEHWNPAMLNERGLDLDRYRFDNFIKEVYLDSDTKVALVSSAPTTGQLEGLLISNEQMAETRKLVNRLSGTQRMLCHSVIIPGQDGWLDEVDRNIEELQPNSWKGYTVGNPYHPQNLPYRLDDEKLMYPFYEKMVKSGINTICIHKGLLPRNYLEELSDLWPYATVDDVGKAAKDWPQINFVIYHAALRPYLEKPDIEMAEFEKTGYIRWVTDLADIPRKYGVSNVYGEIGSAFANSAITNPRFCAALMGTLIKGMGVDHVLWGTDSVWYGSPQWQIEALRRLEIPQDMQERFGFAPLGPEDGYVKNAIFGLNGARLYNLNPQETAENLSGDVIAQMKTEYHRLGVGRSLKTYGYVTN
ncbi:amidohydrolase family protein [Pseudomaricurvus alkylphenolicus]|jgi:predicted TIM-barrel fold metal-dependent hydrolase|uniref:amidohydrolase family protein n=1 Tax=Pseudomaricurvus alkylphenolicus TaxID=1306991 RepID=UPI0014203354|nr:amidohydrolase family protein [Pseudomaricurvus alkylphenolicus]NIB38937.1 amidohydrolase family protein [Pseudomaricurvus alkylphenolicus]